METKPDERPGRDWFTRAEICSFHGITEQTFDRTYRPLMSESAIQRKGVRSWHNGPAYLEAVIAYKVRIATKRDGGGGSDDGGLGVGATVDVEAAKRLVRAKAKEQELKVEQMLRQLVSVEEIHPALMNFSDVLRRAGETLQRQFGPEASLVLNEAIDEGKLQWQKLFNGANGDRAAPP